MGHILTKLAMIRACAAFSIAVFLFVFAGVFPVNAEESPENYELVYSTDEGLSGRTEGVFAGLSSGDVREIRISLNITSCRAEKVFLYLEAESDEDPEWDVYDGTDEALYASYFRIRKTLFDPENRKTPSREELAELEQTFYDTWRADPDETRMTESESAKLLNKMQLTIREETEGDQDRDWVELSLSKKTALLSLAKSEEAGVTLCLSIPEELTEEEKHLLRGIRWKLTAEEINTHPELQAEITLTNAPQNGKYFTAGETVSVMSYYSNTGDTELIHIIGRLIVTDQNGRESVSVSDSIWREEKSPAEEKGNFLQQREGFQWDHRITEQEEDAGCLRLKFEVEASCPAPLISGRIRETAMLEIPVGHQSDPKQEDDRIADKSDSEAHDVRSDSVVDKRNKNKQTHGRSTIIGWIVMACAGISIFSAAALVIYRKKRNKGIKGE